MAVTLERMSKTGGGFPDHGHPDGFGVWGLGLLRLAGLASRVLPRHNPIIAGHQMVDNSAGSPPRMFLTFSVGHSCRRNAALGYGHFLIEI